MAEILGEAPLHDPVALAAWNRRAREILGMPDAPSAWEVAKAQIITAAGDDEPGATDSFSRIQEQRRRGHKPTASAKSREGSWEEERRKLAAMPELRSKLQGILPPRPPGWRAPIGIRKPGRIQEVPTEGAWERKESMIRGHRNALTAQGITEVWKPAPAGETPWLQRLFTLAGITQREAAERTGLGRSAVQKWIRADDSIGGKTKESIAIALRSLMPTILTLEAIRAARHGGSPTLPEKILHCPDCDGYFGVIRRSPAARCAECAHRRKIAQTVESRLRKIADPGYREARNARARDYWQENHERQLARKREYYQENREALLERKRPSAWTPEQRERRNAYRRAYHRAHPEKSRTWKLAYLTKQREAQRAEG